MGVWEPQAADLLLEALGALVGTTLSRGQSEPGVWSADPSVPSVSSGTDPLWSSAFSYVKLPEYQLPHRAVREIKWDNICKTQLPAWLGVKLSRWLVIIIVVSAISKCHSSEHEWGCARDLEGAGS